MRFGRFVAMSTVIVLSLTGASVATAATLTGDTVKIRFLPEKLDLASNPVGPGFDLLQYGFGFDFDGGASGDEFTFFDNGGSFGRHDRVLLRDLDFSDGHVLVGFELTGGSLSDLRVGALTEDSVVLRFTAPGSGPNDGPAIQGRFLTAVGAMAPVPLPAGLPLLLAGLGAFAALARRRRGAA